MPRVKSLMKHPSRLSAPDLSTPFRPPRQMSPPPTKTAGDLNAATLRHLECPICLEHCAPPIYQCANGHNTCAKCRPRVERCAVCRAAITDVRNRFAEQMSAQVRYPCRYKGEGCEEMSYLAEREGHEGDCSYGTSCYVKVKTEGAGNRYMPCKWSGRYEDLRHHVEQKHPTWIGKGENVHISSSLKKTQFVLISAFDELFWCITMYNFKTSTLQGYVCLVGSSEKAAMFDYEFRMHSYSNGNECSIVNRGRVVLFEAGRLPSYQLDETGDNVIVEGRLMVQRFVEAKNFLCRVSILKAK